MPNPKRIYIINLRQPSTSVTRKLIKKKKEKEVKAQSIYVRIVRAGINEFVYQIHLSLENTVFAFDTVKGQNGDAVEKKDVRLMSRNEKYRRAILNKERN